MARKKELTMDEKNYIIQEISKGKSTLQISKDLNRDHRTIKKICEMGIKPRKKKAQAEFRKLTKRDLSHIRREVIRNPNASSAFIFESAGAPKVSRETRCKALRKFANVRNQIKKPILTKKHKENRLLWAKKYMKTDFSKVLFTDESRITLDGPDGWARGWVCNQRDSRHFVKRQQGGGSIMIWAGIIGNELVGPFRVEDGVKMNSKSYCEFLDQYFFEWLDDQPIAKRRSLIFMQDNAPSHASKLTKSWLQEKGFVGETYMDWPANSCDLNPIENLWSILKREIYRNSKQFNSKHDLWEAVKVAANNVSASTIVNLTSDVDNRLVRVLENKGASVQ